METRTGLLVLPEIDAQQSEVGRDDTLVAAIAHFAVDRERTLVPRFASSKLPLSRHTLPRLLVSIPSMYRLPTSRWMASASSKWARAIREPPLFGVENPQVPERLALDSAVADVARHGERTFLQGPSLVEFSLVASQVAERQQHERFAVPIAERAVQRERFLECRAGLVGTSGPAQRRSRAPPAPARAAVRRDLRSRAPARRARRPACTAR